MEAAITLYMQKNEKLLYYIAHSVPFLISFIIKLRYNARSNWLKERAL